MTAKSQVSTLIGMSFLFAGGFTAVSPVLPDIIEVFDVSAAQASLLLTVFALGRIALNVLGGMIADRMPIGPVVGGACAITLTGSVLALVTEDFGFLLAARILQGMGTALYMVAATGHIMDVAPRNRLPRLLAWNQSMMLVGMSLGPTVGGLSSALWGYRGPFVIFALYSALGLLPALTLMRGRRRHPAASGPAEESDPEERSRLAAVAVFVTPLFLTVIGVSMVASAIRGGVRSTVVPLQASDVLGFDAAQIGYLLTVSGFANVIVMWPVARSIEVFGWRRVMMTTMPLCALPLVALTLVARPWEMYVAVSLLAMVTGFAGVVSVNAIAELVAPSIRKTAVGVDRTARDLAFLVSPVASTKIADSFGYSALFLGITGVVLVLGLGAVWTVRRDE